jgi:hypothetical protein
LHWKCFVLPLFVFDKLALIIYFATPNDGNASVWLLGELIADTHAKPACEFLMKEKMISALSHHVCPFCQAIYMTFV